MFYKGNTPDIFYYSDINLKDYKTLVKKDGSFKDELLSYLENYLYTKS